MADTTTSRRPIEAQGVLFFTDAGGFALAQADGTVEQAIEAARTLKAEVRVMPDMHHGYGLPIGGVAATPMPDGAVSPGAVGFDIGCGVRFATAPLTRQNVTAADQQRLADALRKHIVAGVGRGRGEGQLELTARDFAQILLRGAAWLVERGMGFPEDLQHMEAGGFIDTGLAEADIPRFISERALARGMPQVGTLGAGNHFAEIGFIREVYDPTTAAAWGLEQGGMYVMLHTGSRGFGHQVATDYVAEALAWLEANGQVPRNKNLAWVPAHREVGQRYLTAMRLAANFAFANRQLLLWHVRLALKEALGVDGRDIRMLWGLHHNMAKVERHADQEWLVHRKGATRAFGPARSKGTMWEATGQPVLVPGSMGTMSFVMAAQDSEGNDLSFATANHGSGRRMSRSKAKKSLDAAEVRRGLEASGILAVNTSGGDREFLEEAPDAYKDSGWVSGLVEEFGIARRVVGVFPWVVLKG